ncbi:hypothetical protein J3D47_005658 [Pseudomonas laurylsulfativorans]|nr:hypothetical protein [Pseudomonas laurylsulfativorans]
MLAKNLRTTRLTSKHALSLTFFASMLAPTGEQRGSNDRVSPYFCFSSWWYLPSLSHW